MLILPARHHSRQCANQHLLHSIHRHHLHTHPFQEIVCSMRDAASESPDRSKLLPAQHQPIVYRRHPQGERTSNCCQCFHPQRLLYHSWPTQTQSHLKSHPKFQPARYFECFRAESGWVALGGALSISSLCLLYRPAFDGRPEHGDP